MKKILLQIILILPSILLFAETAMDTVPNTQTIGKLKTSWDEFETASPSEGIPFIEVPEANLTGDATCSFPLVIPEARNGLSPNLSIDYSSDSGNTWLGTGWDLSLPSITLDTRWGVPIYDPNIESEIYLIHGEQLGPVFHRAIEYTRESEREFHFRQESSFQKIIRHGNSPKNYWWEIKDKNGLSHFYGGTSEQGFSNPHALQTADGNITEWHLAETKDIYGNIIKYSYQKVSYQAGRCLYPQHISYNGHNGSDGNYTIDFVLKDRNDSNVREDVVINCRTGMQYAMADLLEKITISYKDQTIRSYRFDYLEGRFAKTLLRSISEYNQDDDLFYQYELEYHDDLEVNNNVMNLFGPGISWNVPKDNIDVLPVSATAAIGFLDEPTILGGAKSISNSVNTAFTIGLIGNLASKENTIGPNGGGGYTTATGLTTLVDIDSDGLPDKLWKEDGRLYYRPNLNPLGTGNYGFSANKYEIKGVTDFSLSNTISFNIGAEVNVGIASGVSGFFGYSYSNNTTNITTYMADYNGDELLDIVHDKKVYFNTLDSDNRPNFGLSSSATESPIFTGDPLDPSLVEVDPDEQSNVENANPLHDAVKLWIAPNDGVISISGSLNLMDVPVGDDPEYRDGVIVMIQHQNNELWRERIQEDDFTLKTPTGVGNILVSKDDSIFFRVHSVFNGHGDQVNWDPVISYQQEDLSETTIDRIPLHQFQASKDFLTSDNSETVFVKDGIVSLEGRFIKPITTDSVFLQLRNGIVWDTVFAPSEIVDMELEIEGFTVSQASEIKCNIDAKSNIDWTAIEWNPRFVYTSFDDGSEATDLNGNPTLTICPKVEYRSFNVPLKYGEGFVIPESGEASILAEVYIWSGVVGTGYFTSKLTSSVDSIGRTQMVNDDNLFQIDLTVEQGDTLFAEFGFPLDNVIYGATLDRCLYVMGADTTEIECFAYARDENYKFNTSYPYRGWSQFVYNANNGRGQTGILLGSLNFDEDAVVGDTLLIEEDVDSTQISMNNIDMDELFSVMRSDPKSLAWRGSDSLTFVNAFVIASSRNGLQDVDLSRVTVPSGNEFSSVNLKTKSDSHAIAAGGAVGQVDAGGGVTPGKSWSLVDVSDLNGDRFPDIMYENSIQYTGHRGGLTQRSLTHNWGTHLATSLAKGGGIGGSYQSTSAKNSGASPGKGTNKSSSRMKASQKGRMAGSRSAYRSSQNSIGISGNFTHDTDKTKHTFADINGDGLEDKIWEGGQVALNLGYEFAEKTQWNFNDIRTGEAFDGGGGVGISYDNNSFVAGLSISGTGHRSLSGFTDINNDALPDLIVSTEPLVVKINTGSGFTDAITLAEMGYIDSGLSIGESLNVGGTVCIPFVFIKVCVNIVVSSGQGTSSVQRTFADIDGDGYVDLLSADGDDANLISRSSNIRRTNLLKNIRTPLGGSIAIDYKLEGNNHNMPFSKWVMSALVIDDGVEGDGLDVNYKSFTYADPYYDRNERILYGFGEVNDIYINEAGETLREIATKYHVRDYYRKGLKKEENISDGDGKMYQQTVYTYGLFDIASGLLLPPSFDQRDDGMCFPALLQKVNKSYEGLDEFLARTYHYEYDAFGNIISYTDIDETGNTLLTITSYQHEDDRYLHSNITTEQIYGNGELYRSRVYELDELGNILAIREQINDQQTAITNMTYDIYGNVLSKSNPENYKLERLDFEYRYDEEEHQYLIYEKNGYGEEEHYTYEYLYNEMSSYTDINGNETVYDYDRFGRKSSVTYPKENSNALPYSIRYEYYPAPSSAYAIAYHFDANQNSDLRTIEFEDGLFRSIQTKADASIYQGGVGVHKMIVSGTEAFDEMGRYHESYQPLSEFLGSENLLNTQTNPISPTRFSYDLMDRLVRAEDSYGAVTSYEYGIASANNGKRYLSLEITHPLGNKEMQFFNLRGDIVAEKYEGPNGSIWRNYEYDGFNQVVKIIDHFGNETFYSYDLLGRRVSVKVPDAGETVLHYDKAGNLTNRITATIREVINENGSIRYQYDKERLVQIDYPKHFQNKVIIHYGTAQDSFNRTGRIWLIEDATGGREYFFDELGNPVKTIRTVMINRSNVFTYVSEASYDSWGRVLDYTYPDGERLEYQYGIGGQLKQMIGSIGSETQIYLSDVAYDEHLDPVYIEYGNAAKEEFVYDNKRRIAAKRSILSDGSLAADEIFEYDFADQLILKKNNSAAQNIGGTYSEEYSYDVLYRLSSAKGQWRANGKNEDYDMFFDYDELNNLTMKNQVHRVNDEQQIMTTRILDYEYEHEYQPTRPSKVGGRQFHYDANGNLLLKNSNAVFDFDQNIFDEENRLIGSSNNGYISRYTYDAFGHRTIKSHGEQQGVFINGAPAGFLEHKSNFVVAVSPYFTVFKNDYRKHYYLGNLRILTKLGTGVFQTNLAQVPGISAGGIDYKKRIKEYEDSILEYYADLGVAPGPPTLLALLGQPEINATSLPDADGENPWNTAPGNWPILSPPDTLGPPGSPVFYENASINNENVEAGYNFSLGNFVKELEQFYYHYDQNGSTQYVTDYAGEARQYSAYFPSGERWISETTTADISPFQWNALVFDEETGMYDLGNIYYDPTLNIEQSIDPILQNFGEQTFLNRPEGELFYDYAMGGDQNDDPSFDLQILNAERPSPFTGVSANGINPFKKAKTKDMKLTEFEINEAFGGSIPWDNQSEKVDKSSKFSSLISEVAPQLAVVDISDQAEVDRVVQKYFDDSVADFKKKLKKALGLKQSVSTKSKTKKVGRKVRFK